MVAAGQALAPDTRTLAALTAVRVVAVDPGCVNYLVARVGYLAAFSPPLPTRVAVQPVAVQSQHAV